MQCSKKYMPNDERKTICTKPFTASCLPQTKGNIVFLTPKTVRTQLYSPENWWHAFSLSWEFLRKTKLLRLNLHCFTLHENMDWSWRKQLSWVELVWTFTSQDASWHLNLHLQGFARGITRLSEVHWSLTEWKGHSLFAFTHWLRSERICNS